MRGDWLGVLITSAALAAPVGAQWRDWEADFDKDTKPWREIEAKIPAYPVPDGLLPFAVSAASPHRFYVDAQSLSIGEDGVVRYTLVIKAAGGAMNVTYEGIRCELGQQKLYAVGRADGTWARARNPQWRAIEQRKANSHHAALFRDYLCDGAGPNSPVASVGEALQKLKYAHSPAPE